MCLVTIQEKPLIATEDIICYKILTMKNDKLISLYMGYSYKLDFLYKNTLFYQKLHAPCCSYYTKFVRRHYCSKYKDAVLTEVSDGYHSVKYMTTFDTLLVNMADKNETKPKKVMVECIIPKGSEYFEDECNCLVSNQIIINKILG